MLTNEIRPYKCQTNHRRQTCDALNVAQVRVFNVNPSGLHSSETGFNLPTLFVGRNRQFQFVVADEYLKFRHSIGVLEKSSGYIHIFSLEQKKFIINALLSKFKSMEEMSSSDILAQFWISQPKILLDTKIVSDMRVVEILHPFIAYELSVCHKGVDAVGSEQTYESVNKPCPFHLVGIASFVKHRKQQRIGNSLISDAEHEDVDVCLTEFPVGTVHRKHQPFLDRKQRKKNFGNQIKVKGITCKKPLLPSEIGIAFHGGRHGGSYLVEADSLHHTHSMEYKGLQFDAGEIHYGAKMLLHNRDDLITFTVVLGSRGNFHVKSRQTFL